MRIFVAGSTGAIGQPLIAELIRRGHDVTGMTHSDAGARHLAEIGVAVARVGVVRSRTGNRASVVQRAGETELTPLASRIVPGQAGNADPAKCSRN